MENVKSVIIFCLFPTTHLLISVGCTKCQPVTSCNGFISFFYWSGVTISIMETVVNGGAFCKDNELFTPKLNFLSTITLINQR